MNDGPYACTEGYISSTCTEICDYMMFKDVLFKEIQSI